VELRLDRPVRGLELTAVRTFGARGVPRARASAHATQGVPAIVPRSGWGGDRLHTRAAPSYGAVELAFVHHTVTANDYAPADSPAIVLAIAKYHIDSNGWNDIGYNFLVDRYGQLFEGRAGGIGKAVIGAQARGYNSSSTGISNIGTFTEVPQTPEGIDSLSRLIAWKLALHGVPVMGEVTVVSNGGADNRYPSGRRVTLQRISGHRDGDSTECPGNTLYAQLPEIRARAAGEQPPVQPPAVERVTLALGAAQVALPAPVDVSGTVQGPDGSPVAGATVSVQFQSRSGAWASLAHVTSGDDGRFAAQVALHRNGRLRAKLLGSTATIVSDAVSVTVVPTLTASVASARVRQGASALVSVACSPARPRVLLRVERQARSGRWIPVTVVGMGVRGRVARARVRLVRPALYRFTAIAPVDARAGAATSQQVFVRAVHRRRRPPAGGSGTHAGGSGGPTSSGGAAAG